MRRAIRRLSALEYVILLGALLLALVGGALAAAFLRSFAGFPYGISWIVASLLLFIVPALVVYGREMRRSGTMSKRNDDEAGNREPHG